MDGGRLTIYKRPGARGLGNRGCGHLIVSEQFDANSIQFCPPLGVEPYMWGVLRGMTDMWGVEELFRIVI